MEVKSFDKKQKSIDIKRAMIKARYEEMYKAGLRKEIIYETISKEFYLNLTSVKTIVSGIRTGRLSIPVITPLTTSANG
jgi:hypothetical protein